MKKRKIRSLTVFIAVILISTLLTGCVTDEFMNYRPITDLNNLEGRKVGVLIGWSTDYLLSDRDDLMLCRYDTAGDLIMALCYKQLDAVALDLVTANQILGLTTGLGMVDGHLSEEKFDVYFSKDNKEICDDFNTWLKDYKQTEEYEEWLNRFRSFDGSNYEPVNLEQTGTGKTIRIATYYDWYPLCYADSKGVTMGYETEFMVAFANAMNYRLEFVPTTEEDFYMGTEKGLYDGCYGGLSKLYAEEALREGIYVTDFVYEMPIVVVEIKDPDNLEIKGEMEIE